jgi:hypothetical protein
MHIVSLHKLLIKPIFIRAFISKRLENLDLIL